MSVPEPRESNLTRLPGPILGTVLGVVLIAHLGLTWRFTTDDAYISLRYARHLASGAGVSWNLGETAVEGYSNPAFVFLAAAALGAGVDPVLTLKVVGAVSLGAALLLLLLLARSEGRWELGVAAGFVYLGYWGVALWAVSGLETAAYAALALGAVALAGRGVDLAENAEELRGRSARWLLAAGALVFVSSVTRPEGPLVGVAIAIAALGEAIRSGRGGKEASETRSTLGRSLGPVLLGALPPYLVYLGWKLAAFGDVVPNSVRCKMLWEGDPLVLLRDALPLVGWTLPFALWAVARKPRFRRVALLAFALLSLAILYGTDPIIGHANRHALAAWAALLLLAALGAADLVHRLVPRFSTRVVANLLLTAATLWSLQDLEPRLRALRQTAEAYAGREGARIYLADWLGERLAPADRVLLGDTGVVGYLSRSRIVDALCLNLREMPRPPIERNPVAFASWVFANPPEALVLSSRRFDRLDPVPVYGVFPALASRSELESLYRRELVVGMPGDDLFYFVYLRQDRTSGAASVVSGGAG